jgi:glycosyltransferase involved in cell wall biosynthesis
VRRPTVLHVTDRLGVGGAELVIAGLVRELAEQGLAESIVCTATPRDADPGLVAELRRHARVVVTLDRRHLFDARMTAALARLIGRQEIDVVHSHPGTAHVHARAAAALRGRPHVTTVHTPPGPEIEDSRARLLSDAMTWRYSARIVAPSQSIAGAYARSTGVAAERMCVIGNAPAAHRVGAPAELARLDRELRAGDVGGLVLCVARLVPAKAIDQLVRACVELRARAPGVRLVVAGSGPCEAELRALIADLGLGDTVRLLGRRDDVGSLLAVADVFCLPSRHEGVPLSVLEAMAAGVPCVATAVGGVTELIEHRRTGLVVPPDSPDALTDAIGELLADPAGAGRIGEAARTRVERDWSAAVQARRYAELYGELAAVCGGSRRRSGRSARSCASGPVPEP